MGLTSVGMLECAVDNNSFYTDLRLLGNYIWTFFIHMGCKIKIAEILEYFLQLSEYELNTVGCTILVKNAWFTSVLLKPLPKQQLGRFLCLCYLKTAIT